MSPGSRRRLLAPAALRPPGALPPAEFEARCIRCGRCAAACPYRAIRPAGLRHGLSAGTPAIVPAEEPCWLCMKCPPSCPTGALAPVAAPRDVRMGVARVNEETCYAFLGILCRTCVDRCPLQGEAIRHDASIRPVVTDLCAGCGICEKLCPAPGVAIRVVPRGSAA